jgi:hypothetical protein
MSSTDLKTSLLVNRQVPEFVRDEYPKFVTFLEAYYQFLEGNVTATTTANNLVTTAKNLRNIRDVDTSLDEFEKNFYNTYATLIPLDIQTNKELLFKHLVPLYKSKGSDASFKLLFQLIFGVDIDVVLPKNNVLKASSSKWQIDNKLRINQDIASVYTGDGISKTFTLAQIVGPDEISVFVNGTLQSNFFVNKEYRKLNFRTAPANGSLIRVVYDNFDTTLLNNRKVIGLKSGASAIIEQANRRIISDSFNLGLPVELLINPNSLIGIFLNGEYVTIPIINSSDPYGNTINIEASTFSIVKRFNIISGGQNYHVGDTVTVIGGNASINAIGTVSSIFEGKLQSVQVLRSGSVFGLNSPVVVSGNGAVTMTITVDAIDQSGVNAANTFIVVSDVIKTFNGSIHAANTVINVANFAFANSTTVTSPNASTRIIDVLGFQTLSVGTISNVKVLITSGGTSTTPSLDAFGIIYGPDLTTPRTPKSLRSIGRIKINNAGSGYVVGDEVVFGVNPPGTYGSAAAAVVEAVTPSGGIVTIGMANTRIQGTATISGTTSVGGTGTKFLTDLRVGDKIDINGESRTVSVVNDDSTVTVGSSFTTSASGKKIGVFGRHPKGGVNYTQGNFPTITVSSATGVGANVQIDSLVSDGESLLATGAGQPGAITGIQVLNPGSGYEYSPIVTVSSLTGTLSSANADIEQSYLSSPGRWTTSDSIISSTERKIAGQDYYVDYSYVISSQVEFYRYKQLLKELLHPVGFVKYAELNKSNTIDLTDVSVSTINVATDPKFFTVSGNVNVGNGMVAVTGGNTTKFNIALTRNIIVPGTTRVAVNGEIRTVNSVVSNTSLLVSSNVNDVWIANPGSGYSNGFLVFANGGGRIESLSIFRTGSGYESGNVVFTGADEAIHAVATVVANGTGHLQSVTLVSKGLYSNVPLALPVSEPHKVLYANTITITNPGAGYLNGYLNFTGGAPLRAANVSVEVYPSNGAIKTLTVNDSGLYESNPTAATPNSSQSVVVFGVTASNYGSVAPRGNGHSNGVLTFSGGTPTRAAVVNVETYPPNSLNIRSITANTGAWIGSGNGYISFINSTEIVPANARVYVNSAGFIENVTISANGLYIGTPTLVLPNNNYTGNAVLTLTPNVLDGSVRKITIVDSGLYATPPTAVLNTTPISISTVVSNTAPNFTYGRFTSNSYITFTGGDPIINANARIYVFSNGNIQNVTVLNAGLYRSAPTVTTNNSPISVTQVLPIQGGTGYVDGFIIVGDNSGAANSNAQIDIVTNAAGSIVRTVINNVGLYSPNTVITVKEIRSRTGGATGTIQSGTGATFSVYLNANTSNVPVLSVTTATNSQYTTGFTITANSNVVTNATFTISGVSNTETVAVINVGFTGTNTAAQTSIEVYNNSSGLMPAGTVNGAIRRVTVNTPGEYFYGPDVTPNTGGTGAIIRVNSVGTFSQTANAQQMIIWK